MFACTCVCAGTGGTSKRAGKLPVWKEKSDWSGDVIRLLEREGRRRRRREKRGRLDSIKPEACGGKKLFGILHFFSQRLLRGPFFFLFSSRRLRNNFIHDLKTGRLVFFPCRVSRLFFFFFLACFLFLRFWWRWVRTLSPSKPFRSLAAAKYEQNVPLSVVTQANFNENNTRLRVDSSCFNPYFFCFSLSTFSGNDRPGAGARSREVSQKLGLHNELTPGPRRLFVGEPLPLFPTGEPAHLRT